MTRRPQNRENRRKRKRKVFTNRMRGRLKFVFGCVMVGFGVLGAKIIWINAQKGSQYKQQVLTQQGYSSKVIPYKRGDIVDANGTVLATDKKVYDLILEPANRRALSTRKYRNLRNTAKPMKAPMSLESITKSGMYVSIRTKNLRAICLDLPSAEMSACMASRSIITAS